jgi:hypothetical protein
MKQTVVFIQDSPSMTILTPLLFSETSFTPFFSNFHQTLRLSISPQNTFESSKVKALASIDYTKTRTTSKTKKETSRED